MTFILNTDEVAESDRREFVHYALGMTMVPIELHWPDNRRGVKARGAITDLGGLTVCAGQTTAATPGVVRPPGPRAARRPGREAGGGR